MKFLLNAAVIEIGADSNPFADKGFPLTKEQYQAITVQNLAEMLADEFRRSANALKTNPKRIKRLLWMMHDKAQVNALRLAWAGGTQAQFGQVPELAFAGLLSMAEKGVLTMASVDEAVWSKLQR